MIIPHLMFENACEIINKNEILKAGTLHIDQVLFAMISSISSGPSRNNQFDLMMSE